MILRTFLVSLFFLAGCALPVAETADQNFIPDQELTGVSLAKQGLHYFQKSRYVEAELKFRQALYLFPEADNIKLNLAVTLEQLQQFEEAGKLFDAVLSKYPESIDFRAARAHYYTTKGDYQLALTEYEWALNKALAEQAFVKAGDFATSISAISWKIGEEEQGLCYAELAQSITGKVEEVLRFSKLMLAAGDFDTAKSILQSSGSNIEQNARLANRMALIAYAQGDLEEAKKFNSISRDLGLEEPQDKFENEALQIVLTPADELKELEDKGEVDSEQVLRMAQGPAALYLPPTLVTALDEARALRG